MPFQNVKKYHLKNGLTVLLESNRAAPVVSLNVGVKVGSVWERDNEAGLSHVLEHMVFKGTKSYGTGEIASLVEASGGELNAYTSFDQTVYFINLSSRYWRAGLNLIKEMVLLATIDPVELAREQEVILEEIRRGKDIPHNRLSELLFSTSYKKHPYGRPVIGFEKTVRGFSNKNVRRFYNNWYVPNNMVLGVCGNFNEHEMRRAISKEFGSAKPRRISRPSISKEPAPKKYRFAQLALPIQGNYMSTSFPVPAFKHKDTAALDILSHLLGDGETSRLIQILKEKRGLVTSISSCAYTPTFPGLFIIDALIPDKNIKKVLPAISEEINHIKKNGTPPENLDRAKMIIKSSIVYEKETCEGTARKWISYETTAGDFKYEKKYLADAENVTQADIQRVVSHYLRFDRASTALIQPQKNRPSHLSFSGARKPPKEKFQLIEEISGIKKYHLSNGVTILTRENRRLPLISIRQVSHGGLRWEDKKNNGISNLTTSLLEKGTKTKDALTIAEICESIAGHIDASAGRNSWSLSSSFLSEKLEKGIDLFCDVLINPAFEEEEFKKEKKLVLEAIKNIEDSPGRVAFLKFQELLYKKHPYGMPILGTKKSVSSLSQSQIANFYQKQLSSHNSIICAVGDFHSDTLVEMLSEQLMNLPKSRFNKKKLPHEKHPRSIRQTKVRKDKMQAHIVLGFKGITAYNNDRYTFEVLNNILAGQGGRLFINLRDKQSLAYSVTSVLTEGIEPGFFATYIGTEPKKIDQAIKGILGELERIREKKVPLSELKRSRNYIVGNYDLDLQKNSTVASTIAYNELYGHGIREFKDYPKKILSVTSEDVLEVARKYLKLDSYVLSIVGP